MKFLLVGWVGLRFPLEALIWTMPTWLVLNILFGAPFRYVYLLLTAIHFLAALHYLFRSPPLRMPPIAQMSDAEARTLLSYDLKLTIFALATAPVAALLPAALVIAISYFAAPWFGRRPDWLNIFLLCACVMYVLNKSRIRKRTPPSVPR